MIANDEKAQVTFSKIITIILEVTKMSKKRIKLTVNQKHVFFSEWEDNPTTQALISQMPLTLQMKNLYNREICYRFGAGKLPIATATNKGYAVGDISYWPPMGSLVILYEQNSEHFQQIPIGHILQDVSLFKEMAIAEIVFEEINE